MTDKKRLKNVRRNFLHRAPDENQDLPTDLPPDSADIHLKENIAENLCFVTDKHQNFKVDHFQSLVESSKDPLVADFSPTNELSLQLGLFPNNPILSPEHLEIESQITPNSDIAAWAYKIIKIYKDYPKKMAQYRQLVQSDNINANASLRKMKLRATLACKKIETSYPHRKMLFLLKKESMTFLSSSSKEGFLKDLGYTFQSWGSWKRGGGASLFLEDDSSVNSSTSYRFLDLALLNMEAVQQGPEYNVYVTDEKGSSEEKMIAQDIHVFEPVAEGVFVSIYFILKERTLLNDHQKRLSELDITEDEPVRVVTNAEMQKRFDENQAG